MASPRRPKPAPPREPQEALLPAYLELYAQHEPFRQALVALYETHCAAAPFETTLAETPELGRLQGTSEAEAYRTAVRGLAARFGLDRLRPSDGTTGSGSGGEQFVHGWCRWRALEGFRGSGRTVPPEAFALMAGAGGRPDIGDVVSVEQWRARSPGDETGTIVDERREPVVRVQLEDAWDPRSERQIAAEERLLAQATRLIRAELDRIAQGVEFRGYAFADARPREPEHLRWLFARAALGLRYHDIAPTESAATVSKRVGEYGALLGVDVRTKKTRAAARRPRASAQP